MKRMISILVMVVLLVMSTSAFGVEITITSPSGEQTKTEYTLVTTQSSSASTDFSNCAWGMTFDEVQSAEGEQEWSTMDDGAKVYLGTILGLDAMMCFAFDSSGKLYKGTIMINEKHSNDNLYISDYNKLKKALTEKYGTPTKDQTKWLHDLFKDDPSYYGLAVATGDLIYGATWQTNDTDILIILGGDNYVITHAIVYTDKNYVKVTDTTGL